MLGPVPGDSDSDRGRWNFEQVPQVTVHRALELTGLHCPVFVLSLSGDEELPLPVAADLI